MLGELVLMTTTLVCHSGDYRLPFETRRRIDVMIEHFEEEYFMIPEFANISISLYADNPLKATPNHYSEKTEAAMPVVLPIQDENARTGAWNALNEIRYAAELNTFPFLSHGFVDAFNTIPDPPRDSALRSRITLAETTRLWKRVRESAGKTDEAERAWAQMNEFRRNYLKLSPMYYLKPSRINTALYADDWVSKCAVVVIFFAIVAFAVAILMAVSN